MLKYCQISAGSKTPNCKFWGDFLSFVEQPVHMWLKVRKKWVGSYCCGAALRSVITMKPTDFISEKADSNLDIKRAV